MATNLNLTDAKVIYYKDFVSSDLSTKIFEEISETMKDEDVKRVANDINDTTYKLKRKTMVFIQANMTNYVIPKIWGSDITILEFTPELAVLKESIEKLTGYEFNICLANYYSTGKNNIGWHSDNEEKGDIECIASVSLGTVREFAFRTKGQKDVLASLNLANGSLLIMDKGCQDNYEHCLMPNKEIKTDRLNLTFRKFKFESYSKK